MRYALKVPDKFQNKDEVEEKINEICKKHYTQYLEPELRELVELVRKNK